MVGDARFLHFRAGRFTTGGPVCADIPEQGNGLFWQRFRARQRTGQKRTGQKRTGQKRTGQKRISLLTVVCAALLLLLQTDGFAQTTQIQTDQAAEFPVIPDKIRSSLLDHPSIQTGRARTCQAIHRLGIQHAELRPQLSGHINSERQLFGHFKSSNNQGDRGWGRGPRSESPGK